MMREFEILSRQTSMNFKDEKKDIKEKLKKGQKYLIGFPGRVLCKRHSDTMAQVFPQEQSVLVYFNVKFVCFFLH